MARPWRRWTEDSGRRPAPADRDTTASEAQPASVVSTPSPFYRVAPSPKNAVDIFSGEWSSRLPAPYEELTGAQTGLFDDPRIHWGANQFGGVEGLRVLELGPLEGGHTYMLDRKGAREVVAIEANQRAFLRCLIVKELLGIPSGHFLCGDFVDYLADSVLGSNGGAETRFDLCLAVGVLYHQQDPVALLDLCTRISDRVLLWTHYYDESVISSRPDLAGRFEAGQPTISAGFSHTLYRQHYGSALEWGGFCGGLETTSSWMLRDEILGCMEHLGFKVLGIEFDDPAHPNGPAFCVAANRRQ